MADSGKYGQVTVERDSKGHPLNGTDEPVFLIRASDKVALLALVMYRQAAVSNGAGPTIDAGMEQHVKRFREWQANNPDSVRIPD